MESIIQNISRKRSTAYGDGFRDAYESLQCSPPDVQVFRSEYLEGFADGQLQLTTEKGLSLC
jgi:hypothetical protein